MADISPPEILPIFPLTGVLLLPGMVLPLHIFEPRYRSMVADALREGAHIGMVQPFVARQDNRPLPGAEMEAPELYPVGCAGRLERHEQAPDGRYLIELRGVSRFRIAEELPPREGYRRVRAEYGDFGRDATELSCDVQTAPLLEALRSFNAEKDAILELEQLERLPSAVLVNSLAMSLPYSPPEKQALLEASGPEERARTLLELLRVGSTVDPFAPPAPPKLN